MMRFTNGQLERYSRHIVMKELGIKGQKKISSGKVLVIGAGGLGSPAAMYLAAAGVGTIGIADGDAVELSNLQRQILHKTENLGKNKAESAREAMLSVNPEIIVKAYPERVHSGNILEIIADYDFVLDGTDNLAAKYLINDACVMMNKPFTHGGVLQFFGQVTTVIPKQGPCYRCMFREPPKAQVRSCGDAGIVGAIPGVIGSIQALEAIKYLTGLGELLVGKLLMFDALTMDFDIVELAPRGEGCAVCSEHPTITKLTDYSETVCS